MKDCCSFFSAARRTNQEALPQLSGLSARRLGRRRGLRNSLRSNSPRPFSSVFLATLPPDKGGINQSFFRFYSTFFFQSPRPADTSPIFPNGNTGGEDWKWCFSFGIRIALCTSPLFVWLRHTPQCYGARQERSFTIAPIVKTETPCNVPNHSKKEVLTPFCRIIFFE